MTIGSNVVVGVIVSKENTPSDIRKRISGTEIEMFDGGEFGVENSNVIIGMSVVQPPQISKSNYPTDPVDLFTEYRKVNSVVNEEISSFDWISDDNEIGLYLVPHLL